MKDDETRGDNIEKQVAEFLSGERQSSSNDSDEAQGWIEASESALWAYREEHSNED
jgi:hypothetical protein